MRIRSDFVTNSSSTSFVIIAKGDFEEDDFYQLLGVDQGSPLMPIFKALYVQLQEKMCRPQGYYETHERASENWLDLLRKQFPEEVVERICQAEQGGGKAFIGKLSSDDGSLIEAFFCTDSFEIENEKLYFNALECIW